MAIFNSKKSADFNPQEINILNAGTSIVGDVLSEGDIRIDGSVQGNVQVKTKLVIGASSTVHGNIKAQNADISGNVTGNITITDLLTVKASAQISGDIICSKLILEAGAIFNGHSKMGVATKELNGATKVLNQTERISAPQVEAASEKS